MPTSPTPWHETGGQSDGAAAGAKAEAGTDNVTSFVTMLTAGETKDETTVIETREETKDEGASGVKEPEPTETKMEAAAKGLRIKLEGSIASTMSSIQPSEETRSLLGPRTAQVADPSSTVAAAGAPRERLHVIRSLLDEAAKDAEIEIQASGSDAASALGSAELDHLPGLARAGEGDVAAMFDEHEAATQKQRRHQDPTPPSPGQGLDQAGNVGGNIGDAFAQEEPASRVEDQTFDGERSQKDGGPKAMDATGEENEKEGWTPESGGEANENRMRARDASTTESGGESVKGTPPPPISPGTTESPAAAPSSRMMAASASPEPPAIQEIRQPTPPSALTRSPSGRNSNRLKRIKSPTGRAVQSIPPGTVPEFGAAPIADPDIAGRPVEGQSPVAEVRGAEGQQMMPGPLHDQGGLEQSVNEDETKGTATVEEGGRTDPVKQEPEQDVLQSFPEQSEDDRADSGGPGV